MTDQSSSPPKPCLARLQTTQGQTWCLLAPGHTDRCSGVLPRLVESDDLGPGASKRRRY
jgi:hypothetical protein